MELNISPDMPPRHRGSFELCMQAALHGGCPRNHLYHAGELSPMERRWLYVEMMLEELAQLVPDSGQPPAGSSFDVDDVTRAEDGLIATIFGTRFRLDAAGTTDQHPYILGDV